MKPALILGMQDLAKLTRKDLKKLSHEEKDNLIFFLIEQVIALRQEVEELKHKLNLRDKNSSNSSKPPSSDINKPNRNQSQREKTGRKPGGQNGHEGITRNQINNPDKIIQIIPESCELCGKKLSSKKAKLKTKRQVFDLPEIRPLVTEYQSFESTCRCGYCNVGAFPQDVKAPVQLGPNICSFMIYLNAKHVIPYERLCMISGDLLGFDISKGSIENILERTYQNSKYLHNEILENIQKYSWIGSDETSSRVEGKKWWLWVWQNFKGSCFAITDNRGYKTIKERFGEDYTGRMVHDCWAAQFMTIARGGHQACLEHLCRELKFIIQYEKSKWASMLRSFLYRAIKVRDKIWEKGFNLSARKRIITRHLNKFEKLLKVKVKHREENRVKDRLIKYKDNILFFMKSKDMPCYNNSSEQAIRIAKIKDKISYGFRSQNGAERFAVLLSIIETCKKQGLDIFTSIKKLVLNEPLHFQWA